MVIPNFLRNHEEIVAHCIENKDKFVLREDMGGHSGPLPVVSKFKSYTNEMMDNAVLDMIFADCDFEEDVQDFYMFVQIQMYEPGDFIVPHRDNYSVKTLHLVTLTTSDCDALIVQKGKDLIRIPDVAGQKIEENLNDFHWVDPVRDLRFTLVVGE